MKRLIYSVIISLVTATTVFATGLESLTGIRSDDFNYSEYYYIKESANSNTDLLFLTQVEEDFPLPQKPYNRDKHFGGWLKDEQDGSCLNTRAKVLIRDSKSEVEFNSSGCSVNSGDWDDPYTGRNFTQARDIQIDHVVALKNAYMSGAHEWDFQKRCLYANYMGNNFHLMSVNGKENLRKSDKTPKEYVPPNQAYVCEFIKNWLFVKLIWTLRLTPSEVDAISQIAEENECSKSMYKVSARELREQRKYMQENADLCSQMNPVAFVSF